MEKPVYLAEYQVFLVAIGFKVAIADKLRIMRLGPLCNCGVRGDKQADKSFPFLRKHKSSTAFVLFPGGGNQLNISIKLFPQQCIIR